MTSPDQRSRRETPRSDALQRSQAEALVRVVPAPSTQEIAAMSPEAVRQVLHELQVHQIELEMQNEELRRTQQQLDAERARYVDLYDLAPVGYCTVDAAGLIQQANLAAAALLGVPRAELTQRRISRFIVAEDQDSYYLMRQRLLQSAMPQSLELRMLKHDARLWAHLEATVVHSATGAPLIHMVLSDITERKQAQEEQRIASIAFRGHGGVAVMDAQRKILRVNPAFTQITGYSEPESRGLSATVLRTKRHADSFYEQIGREIERSDEWRGEMWLRRKNGSEFAAQVTVSVVRDDSGMVTQVVSYFVDATSSRLQEQSRRQDEAAHRNLLVREVHHRIKNNLQAIIGILRKFANRNPQIAPPLQQAIGQVQTISVVHGLQGRAVTSSVRLTDLIQAIAQEIQELWHTPIDVQVPAGESQQVLCEDESVPVALVLHELISNAVKHGGQAHGRVHVSLRPGAMPDGVRISIDNAGHFASDRRQTGIAHSGLHLIAALMPRVGARIEREQRGDQVITMLELEPPVISLDSKEPSCPPPHHPFPANDC